VAATAHARGDTRLAFLSRCWFAACRCRWHLPLGGLWCARLSTYGGACGFAVPAWARHASRDYLLPGDTVSGGLLRSAYRVPAGDSRRLYRPPNASVHAARAPIKHASAILSLRALAIAGMNGRQAPCSNTFRSAKPYPCANSKTLETLLPTCFSLRQTRLRCEGYQNLSIYLPLTGGLWFVALSTSKPSV